MKKQLKQLFKSIRSLGTFWLPAETVQHLEAIRTFEINHVIDKLGSNRNLKLLEIGGGRGWQAKFLSDKGYKVESIDVYSHENKVWPVKTYDGINIPFDDDEFDLIFSSNVLEHIYHVSDFQEEIQRVLKKNGLALHIVPSASWRFWTIFTEIIKRWRPPLRHGEHAHNAFSELFYFKQKWWKNLFEKSGWDIIETSDNGLFYTGSALLDIQLSLQARAKYSRYLGCSCHVFLLRNKKI